MNDPRCSRNIICLWASQHVLCDIVRATHVNVRARTIFKIFLHHYKRLVWMHHFEHTIAQFDCIANKTNISSIDPISLAWTILHTICRNIWVFEKNALVNYRINTWNEITHRKSCECGTMKSVTKERCEQDRVNGNKNCVKFVCSFVCLALVQNQ